MGKTTGFLEYERCENPFRPERERMQDFEFLHSLCTDEQRRE